MRIGLVGAGTMARVHAEAYRRMGAELMAVYAPDAGEREAFAERYGLEPFSDYQAFLRAVEVVDVVAPTDVHEPLAVAALEAGRDVILEKPIALDLASGERIVRAAREHGRRLFVAMVVRFFPQYRRAAELVQAGELGRLGVVRLKRVSFLPKIPWYRDPARSGGMVVDLMIHDLDYARWLLGDPVRVFARRARVGEGEHVQAVLGFEGGATAFIEGGWAYPEGHFRTAFDLAGDRGLLEWSSDAPGPIRTILPAGAEVGAVGLPLGGLEEDPYELELRHALSAIEAGAPFEVSPEDALAALRLALLVRESADREAPLEVT